MRSRNDFPAHTLCARIRNSFGKEFALCSPFGAFCSIVPSILEQGIRRRRCRRVASAREILDRCHERVKDSSVVRTFVRQDVAVVLSFRGERSTLIADAGNEKSQIAKKISDIKRDSTGTHRVTKYCGQELTTEKCTFFKNKFQQVVTVKGTNECSFEKQDRM